MQQFKRSLVAFVSDENGLTTVEYAVLGALIIGVCAGAIYLLGSNSASNTYQNASTYGQ